MIALWVQARWPGGGKQIFFRTQAGMQQHRSVSRVNLHAHGGYRVIIDSAERKSFDNMLSDLGSVRVLHEKLRDLSRRQPQGGRAVVRGLVCRAGGALTGTSPPAH